MTLHGKKWHIKQRCGFLSRTRTWQNFPKERHHSFADQRFECSRYIIDLYSRASRTRISQETPVIWGKFSSPCSLVFNFSQHYHFLVLVGAWSLNNFYALNSDLVFLFLSICEIIEDPQSLVYSKRSWFWTNAAQNWSQRQGNNETFEEEDGCYELSAPEKIKIEKVSNCFIYFGLIDVRVWNNTFQNNSLFFISLFFYCSTINCKKTIKITRGHYIKVNTM